MTHHDQQYNDGMLTAAARHPIRLTRPQAPPPFRMTDRHIAILQVVAHYRFVSADQITRCVGGSPRGVRSNLRNLFWHGYLDRPKHQHVYLGAFFDEGNHPLVYALARKGARLLAERGAPVDHRLDWTTKNKRATAQFLAHTIEVADAMLAFHFPALADGAPRLIDHAQLLPLMPQETRSLWDPFKLPVDITHHGKSLTLSVVPDRLFSLALADDTRLNFALELDRGTMDINAKRIVGKSSFRKKLILYFNAWLQKRHTEVWGFQSFRVLTITPSDTRLANMIKAQREVTRDSASGLFLYTTPDRLAAAGPFGPVWISSKADNIALLPSSTRQAK